MTTSDRLWVSEARVQELCGVSRPTWKSWVRSGFIEEDPAGAYDESQVLGIAIVACIREHLGPVDTRIVRRGLERDGRWGELLSRARGLGSDDAFDLVIEPASRAVRLVVDDAELVRAVRHPHDPRPVLVLPIADRVRRIRDGFRTIAVAHERPLQRRRGRPPAMTRPTPPRRIPKRS